MDFTHPGYHVAGFRVLSAGKRPKAGEIPTVLVVDDRAAHGQEIVQALREAGYHAAFVTTFRAAAHHILQLGPPAVMLLATTIPEAADTQFALRLTEDQHLVLASIVLMRPEGTREELLTVMKDLLRASGAPG